MRFTKSILGFAVVLSVLFISTPARASTLTSDQITAVISLLESFNVPTSTLATVNAVLNHLPTPGTGGDHMGTSTQGMFPPGQMGKMMCITLNRNLSVGAQGDDVKNVQDMLRDDDDGFSASSTGFFGPLTAAAMARFQMKNGIATSPTGFVGALTRGFFEHRCGQGMGNDNDGGQHATSTNQGGGPMILLVNGTISANSTSSIMVQPMNGQAWTVNILASTTIYVYVAPPMATSTATSTIHMPPPPPTVGTVANLVVGKAVTVEGKNDGNNMLDAATIRVGMPPPPQMNAGGQGDH